MASATLLQALSRHHQRDLFGRAIACACAGSLSDSRSSTLKWITNKSKFIEKALKVTIAGGLVFRLGGLLGGGGGAGGVGNGGGGDGGNLWSSIGAAFAISKKEDERETFHPHGLPAGISVQVSKLSPYKKYKVSGLELFDNRANKSLSPDDPFYELVTLKPGGIYTKAHLQAELDNLTTSGMFEKVDMEGVAQPDGTVRLRVSFVESEWQAADSFRCINVGLLPPCKPRDIDPHMSDREKEEFLRRQELEYKRRIERSRSCMLPKSVEREIQSWLRRSRRVSARLLQRIKDRVQKWYHDEGYACAQIVNFGNLNTAEVVCEVVEGDITKVDIQFLDKMGNLWEGYTQPAVIRRELPKQLRQGHVFNIEAGKQALRNINALGLFSNIEVNPRPDEKTEGGIVVEVKLKELEPKSADVNTEWSILPRSGGRPSLASIQPGGSVTFEHRNLKGLNRSILGSVTSSNLFNPQDDLGFKMEYVHPYLDGVEDPRNRTFHASCFNSRKLSPAFTGAPGLEEAPAVWVDRAGFKTNITENFTRQSKFSYGIVLEEVTTPDETSTICTHAVHTLPSGALSMDGPPTTLSDSGIDRLGFLQANITRDNSKFINGTPVGARDIFQLDQGLGIGSKFPFFNRHQITVTRLIQLRPVEEGAKKPPPPVLVLHGHYGGCIGDLAPYDAFPLGGPYSVRGYNMGELGVCRNILELAAELRLPVKSIHAYTFVEYGTDLGSSKDVRGNPTEFFHRPGHGASYGFGVKQGLIRAEYAVDCYAGTGSVLVHFGERF